MNTNIRLLGIAAAATLALAGCATSPGYGSGYGNPAPSYGGSPAQCYDCGTVTRIDADTYERIGEPIDVGSPRGSGPAGIAVGEKWVFVILEGEDQVLRIDPGAEFADDAVVATIEVGRRPAYLAGDDDGVWVALEGDLAISRIDPDTDEVADTIELRDR